MRGGVFVEDLHIVELYWERDPKAVSCTEEKYGNYCFAVANHILSNTEDSKECVNDTWLQAWNQMPPHRPNALRMFLAKITRGIAFNRYKANMARKRGSGQFMLALEELAECLTDEVQVEDTVIANELGECIRKFVQQLPVREGDVFVRRYFFTEPIVEIAKNYGLTVNHTTVMLSRTRKKLKQYLIEEGYVYE